MDEEELKKLYFNRTYFDGLGNNLGGLFVSKNENQYFIGIDQAAGAAYFPIPENLYQDLIKQKDLINEETEIYDQKSFY